MLVNVKYYCNNHINIYLIDTYENVAIVNGEKKEFNIEGLEDKILDIIMFWPEKIKKQSFTTQKINCLIKISKNNIEDSFEFINKLPKNFYKFDKLLKEIENV